MKMIKKLIPKEMCKKNTDEAPPRFFLYWPSACLAVHHFLFFYDSMLCVSRKVFLSLHDKHVALLELDYPVDHPIPAIAQE